MKPPSSPGTTSRFCAAAFTAPFGYPEAPQVGGLPKPLSETEVIGHIMQTMLSPEEQRAKAFGTTPVENIVGADGKPVIATRPQAIGRTPVLNEGATGKAAVFTAVYGDGRRLPAVQAAGIDPLWFGIYLILVVEMAQITPPVGFNLFVIQGITGKGLFTLARMALPFFLLLVLATALITIFPDIVMVLPRAMN